MDWLSDWADWILKKGIPQIQDIALLVDEPPCKDCLYWAPDVDKKRPMEIRFCQAKEMEYNFSCFRKKEAPNDNV
jgi:hypothetical protein